MQLTPIGDYYEWYCEWCDSRNLTLWARVEEEKVCCAACYRSFEVGERAEQENMPFEGTDCIASVC